MREEVMNYFNMEVTSMALDIKRIVKKGIFSWYLLFKNSAKVLKS